LDVAAEGLAVRRSIINVIPRPHELGCGFDFLRDEPMPIDTSAIRKLAKSRGLSMKFRKPNYSLFEGEALKFIGDEGATRKFLLAIPGKPRGRPQGYVPPKKDKPKGPGVAPHDYVQAKRGGGYVMKVADGVVRLWADDQLVFESRDVGRLRLFFNNARRGIVPRSKAHLEKEKARFLRVAAQAQRVEARARAAAEKKAQSRLKGRKSAGLATNDPGIESPDHSPSEAEYRGLVLTDIELPPGITGDSALIALWAAENLKPFSASPVVKAKLAAARRTLKREAVVVEVFLSDSDRASIRRYRASASTVLVAAVLARRNLARGDSSTR